MRIVGLLVGAAVLAICAALAVVLSGVLDVAASSPHSAAAQWLLSTTMERSVKRRAAELVPPSLADPDRLQPGFAAYEDMCVDCHGAPGAEPGVIARGLNPEPPRLAEVADEWSDAELFWIVKHGVRMTGMPAFGATHEDDELWDLVAFVRRLPALSEAEYRALREARGSRREHGRSGHLHDHGEGTPPVPQHLHR